MRFLLLLLPILLSGCFGRDNTANNAINTAEIPAYEQVEEGYAIWLRSVQEKAFQIAGNFDDRQLAAQVLISGIDGKGHLTSDMQFLLGECPVGGVMLFKYNLDTDNDAIRNLVAELTAFVETPPFVAVDHEGGAVNRFRAGVADLPPAVSYGEIAWNEGSETAIARITADSFNVGRALNALGINMNLAPVAEYLNEDNRDFLDNRSYGPDPVFTAKAAGAFITGMGQAGILCVVKHFPGSAGPDPHYFPSVLEGDKAALAELAAPAIQLIRSGQARALMVSHSAVPALDTRIASLSPVVMDGWLRQELGFEGIIISDDFSMASAGGPAAAASQLRPETAAVLSLAAGADMVLVWPPDLRRTHRAILAALDDGSLSRERLQEAAGRIIFEKMRMGLIISEQLARSSE